jgi:hypothetical protein
MLHALMLVALLTPPTAPVEREWPGGKWTGDDAEKGKEFAKGSFKYIPKAEYAKYQLAVKDWLEQPEVTKKLNNSNSSFPYKLLALEKTLPAVETGIDASSLVASEKATALPYLRGTSPLKAYGGTGTLKVEYRHNAPRIITVSMTDLDFEQMAAALDIQMPIRITGRVGRLTGTIEGTRGVFTGTQLKVSGDMVSKLHLTIDTETGKFVSKADTVVGTQTFTGKLKTAK